jgi:hypothetical protein
VRSHVSTRPRPEADPPLCTQFYATALSLSGASLHRLRIGLRSDLRIRKEPMRLNRRQDGRNCSETATHIGAETMPVPPIAPCSYSIVLKHHNALIHRGKSFR